ncbi:MAG TPA: hypothetical protein PLT48_15305 [Nitrospira sp.]|nr:hypothetical protein [Nitrospira sp.]
MNSVRMTTKPQQVLERPDGAPAVRRNELSPVGGVEGADADRRRSVREELDAAEERFPTVASDDAQADAHEVVEAIGRLGSDAARVLQPVDVRALNLVLPGHVDEKA